MMTFHVHFVSVSYETRGSLRSREAKNTAFRTYANETRSVYDTNGKKIKKKKTTIVGSLTYVERKFSVDRCSCAR